MNTVIKLLGLVFLFFYGLYAIDVSGNLQINTTWTKSNSPYYLRSDITVEKGVTLELEPGVVVYCFDKDSLYRGGYDIFIKGIIKAIGTEDDSVIFDGYPQHPIGPPSWGRMILYDSTSVDSSIIKYCQIRRSAGGLWCNNTAPEISHCSIEGGLILSGDTLLTPVISHNYIYNDLNALKIWNCSPMVTNNIIRCTGSGNSVVCSEMSKAIFHYNDIYGVFTNSGQRLIDAENNFWGVATEDSILSYHRFNNVDYTPWLNEPYNYMVKICKDYYNAKKNIGLNIPNPYKASTKIILNIDGAYEVYFYVYNLSGEKVRSIYRNNNIINWDGKAENGKIVKNGPYFIYVKFGESTIVKNIIKTQ